MTGPSGAENTWACPDCGGRMRFVRMVDGLGLRCTDCRYLWLRGPLSEPPEFIQSFEKDRELNA